MVRLLAAVLLFVARAAPAAPACPCAPSDAARMEARECSLCREAEKQPPDTAVFFLKDINPRKPNRWLALPRAHSPLAGMALDARARFWSAAIAKARELWGGAWGIAYNGDAVRTQCHLHVHIGKLLAGVENGPFVVADGPEGIPVPPDGTGLWIHPVDGRLHVHTGEQITETVLLR
jgi:hypothetical protein